MIHSHKFSRSLLSLSLVGVLGYGCSSSVVGRATGDGDGDAFAGSPGSGSTSTSGDGDGDGDGDEMGDGDTGPSASGGNGSGGAVSGSGGADAAGGDEGSGGDGDTASGGALPVWSMKQKLTATLPNGTPALGANQHFGADVALTSDGSFAAVGASAETVSTFTYAGAVYLLSRSNDSWSTQQRLVPPTAESGATFGYAIAMTDTVLAVGAPGEGELAGAVYLYLRSGNTWTLQQRLEKPSGASVSGDRLEFGFSVDLSGDTLVVGSPARWAEPYENPGRVYVYTTDGATWSLQQELSAVLPNGTDVSLAGDDFGWSVSLDEDALLIGTPGQSGGEDSGIAYFLRRSAGVWSVETRLPTSESATFVPRGAGARFGWSLALEDDIALISALEPGGPGRVYVFQYLDSTWDFIRALSEDDYPSYGSVAFDGEVAVVGAPTANIADVASEAGAAYVYRRSSGWNLEQKFIAVRPNGDPDGTLGARFGYQAAVAGQTILIGSPQAYVDPHQAAGAVYVFTDD